MQIQITKKYKCHIMMWEPLLKILKSLKITCEEVHFKQIVLKDMSFKTKLWRNHFSSRYKPTYMICLNTFLNAHCAIFCFVIIPENQTYFCKTSS